MTKFYKSKKFKDLRDEWYQKLEEDGFADLEKYGEHMLFSRTSPTLSHLQKRMNAETIKHYTILQTFVHKGNFLRRSLPKPMPEFSFYNIRRKPGSMPIENLADQYQLQYHYPFAEYVLLANWAAGFNLEECMLKLKKMLKNKEVQYPLSLPRPRTPSKTEEPFSIFWVKTRVDYLTKEAYNHSSRSGEELNSTIEFSEMSPEDILIAIEENTEAESSNLVPGVSHGKQQ